MRTSLNELSLLEAYLQRRLPPEDRLLVDARLVLEEDLQERLSLQQRCYGLIRLYGREQIRAQIQRVELELLTQPIHKQFVQKIKKYFK